MTGSHPALQTALPFVHLKASVSRLDVADDVLRANALVTVDLTSVKQTVGVAVVVHWAEPVRSATLGDAIVPPGARSVSIAISRAAPLAEVDVYGFASMAAYVSWLVTALGSGNPPKTAGDGKNVPPSVT